MCVLYDACVCVCVPARTVQCVCVCVPARTVQCVCVCVPARTVQCVCVCVPARTVQFGSDEVIHHSTSVAYFEATRFYASHLQ